MKTQIVDVAALTQKLDEAPLQAALPSHLSNKLLMQTGRELRMAETAYARGDDGSIYINAANRLVLHLLFAHSENLFGKPGRELSLDRLVRWIPGRRAASEWPYWVSRYRYYIEREIVARAVRIPREEDATALLAEIEADIRSFG